jgi:hypothetical protein
MNHTILASLAFAVSGIIAGFSGTTQTKDTLHVLSPITHGNLTIFPIVGGTDYDTSHLLTLDEGVKAGSVIITEQGALRGLIRRGQPVSHGNTAEVNRLVLVNNSDRTLLLLAGEIVTGGKQDRVIGADRLVPAHSDPIDLSVFCVEPGRWVSRSDQFASTKSQMAQPSVRMPAMAAKDQQQVWDRAAAAQSNAVEVTSAAPLSHADHAAMAELRGTTSYAMAMAAPPVQKQIDTVAGNYSSITGELRKAGAKGVVVAVNGQLVWADVFASNDLLVRYWEKLVRSYAAESLTTASAKGHVDQKEAQEFLEQMSGNREVIETEAGVFRRSEITGSSYKVFTLTALLPKTDFNVHTAKMSYDKEARLEFPRHGVR